MQEKEWYPVKFLIGSSTISYDGLYEVNKKGQVRVVYDIRKIKGAYRRVKPRIINIDIDFRGIAFVVLRKEYQYRAVALTNIMHYAFGKGIKERVVIDLPDKQVHDIYLQQVKEYNKNNPKKVKSRAVVQRDINGRFIAKYASMTDAVKAGFVRMSIHNCCNYKASHHKGFKWEYADVDSDGDLADF